MKKSEMVIYKQMLNDLFTKLALFSFFLSVACFNATATEDVRKNVDNAIFDEELRNACHQMIRLLESSSLPGGGAAHKRLPLNEFNRTSRHIFLYGSTFRNLFGEREWEKVAPIIAHIYSDCLKVISEENLSKYDVSEIIRSLRYIHLYKSRLGLEEDENGQKRPMDYWTESGSYRPSSVAATSNERR